MEHHFFLFLRLTRKTLYSNELPVVDTEGMNITISMQDLKIYNVLFSTIRYNVTLNYMFLHSKHMIVVLRILSLTS